MEALLNLWEGIWVSAFKNISILVVWRSNFTPVLGYLVLLTSRWQHFRSMTRGKWHVKNSRKPTSYKHVEMKITSAAHSRVPTCHSKHDEVLKTDLHIKNLNGLHCFMMVVGNYQETLLQIHKYMYFSMNELYELA